MIISYKLIFCTRCWDRDFSLLQYFSLLPIVSRIAVYLILDWCPNTLTNWSLVCAVSNVSHTQYISYYSILLPAVLSLLVYQFLSTSRPLWCDHIISCRDVDWKCNQLSKAIYDLSIIISNIWSNKFRDISLECIIWRESFK